MQFGRWLLIAMLLTLASCRGRSGAPATIVDPFLSGRTTVPPPTTAAVAPLGTIQPYDPYNSTPGSGAILAPGATAMPVLPPGSIPAGTFPPNNSFPTGSAAPATGISPYSGSEYSPVDPNSRVAGGWTTAGSNTSQVIPASASLSSNSQSFGANDSGAGYQSAQSYSPGSVIPASYLQPAAAQANSTPATDIMRMQPVRR